MADDEYGDDQFLIDENSNDNDGNTMLSEEPSDKFGIVQAVKDQYLKIA